MDASAFDDYARSLPGPYEREMGTRIVKLLTLFDGHLYDAEIHASVVALAKTPSRWSAGHDVFDEVRRRLLGVNQKDNARQAEYAFEESCLQAMYNATNPDDPFDGSSPFYIAGQALALAQTIGIPVSEVVAVLTAGASATNE